MEIFTTSAQETQKLGQKIANILINPDVVLKRSEATNPESGFWTQELRSFARMTSREKRKGAMILALYGELGSGKTTFTQGFARGLGLPDRILSPTFIVMREYSLSAGAFKRLYHIDLYRMENSGQMADLGFGEIFSNPANIIVIEWAERLEKLPRERTDITFKEDKGGRVIFVKTNFVIARSEATKQSF